MPLDWLLSIAVTLELGFIIWYVIMLITLSRSVIKDGQNGLTLSMAFLTVSYIFNTLWTLAVLLVIPHLYLAFKIPLDVFKAVMVTHFMWQLDLGERVKQWLKKD